MNNSKSFSIKDLAIGIYDGPHATPPDSIDGPIFLSIDNVTDEGRLDMSEVKHISERDFPKWTKRVIPQKDDIVFSYEATLHRYAILQDGFRGCLGRRMALVRPNQEKIFPRFLHYYFLSRKWRSVIEANIISGATVNRIPIKKFPYFKVSIPALQSQKNIADLITPYDDLIDTNRRRIKLLEESARLLFREWFVYFRFPGHEKVKIVDGMPEGWKKENLIKIGYLNYGKALVEETREEGDVKVYGSSGAVGVHSKPLVEGPGIIVGRKGNVGAIHWVNDSYWPIDTVYYIKKEQSNLFLYLSLKVIGFSNTDASVPGLNRDYAHNKTILVPTKDLLDKFLHQANEIYSMIKVLSIQNQKLAQARDLLLPRLMSGAIEV